MSLNSEKIASIVTEYGQNAANTGATQVQVALLTERVRQLTDHLKTNQKDFHSRVGLMKVVGRRKALLKYLQRKDDGAYRELITRLGLRK